jgi:UDP-N-acetylmuramyl tripeptide synthase
MRNRDTRSPHADRTSVDVRSRAAIIAGGVVGTLSRVTGRGAGQQISGRVMLKIQPDLLQRLSAGKRIIVVSATNGKTTTTRLLTAILEAQGEPVATNATGANLASGVANVLSHAQPGTFCVLEIDERVLPRVYDALRPELLVLGNVSRDQLDRYGEVHGIAESWRTLCTLHPDQAVVANAADPAVVWASEPASTTWVRLSPGWRDDATTCFRCGGLITFTATSFACDACAWAAPDSVTAQLDESALTFAPRSDADATDATGSQTLNITLALPGQWNVDNAALAITAAHRLGVRPAHAAAAVATVSSVSGRYDRYTLRDGRSARVFLAKNPAGWTEVLEYLHQRPTSVVLTINARVADGKDPSWLWDVPFELLASMPVAVAGERGLDLAVRLRHAGIHPIVVDDPLDAADALPGTDVEIIASYTQFHHLTRRMRNARAGATA